jgi:hypothetical protein
MSQQDSERLGEGKPVLAQDDDFGPDPPQNNRPGPLTIVITVLVLLAMLTSLVWPLLYAGPRPRPTPTPTPPFLQEAHLIQTG